MGLTYIWSQASFNLIALNLNPWCLFSFSESSLLVFVQLLFPDNYKCGAKKMWKQLKFVFHEIGNKDNRYYKQNLDFSYTIPKHLRLNKWLHFGILGYINEWIVQRSFINIYPTQ